MVGVRSHGWEKPSLKDGRHLFLGKDSLFWMNLKPSLGGNGGKSRFGSFRADGLDFPQVMGEVLTSNELQSLTNRKPDFRCEMPPEHLDPAFH
jgi:hypothetical protein